MSLGFYPATSALAAEIQPVVYSTSTAQVIIEAYAVKYGVDSHSLTSTLACESGYNADAVGDKGTSFGVAQIHLSAHPEVSREQALDPLWSIDWAAKMFAAGRASMWTCYNML